MDKPKINVAITPNEPVTIYTSGEFFGSINKYEGKLVECGTKQYAQYDHAPYVFFIPKGKRKARGFVKGYQPWIVIVKGVGHPTPPDMFTAPRMSESGMMVKESRYSSFDDRYKTEFNPVIDQLIAEKPELVIMDIRK